MTRNIIIKLIRIIFIVHFLFPLFLTIPPTPKEHGKLKLSNGIDQWTSTWGGNSYETSLGITMDSSDNIYITGFTYSFGEGSQDMFLIKYNSSGDILWNKTWGGIASDAGHGISIDSKDNIYVTGETESFGAGSVDMFLAKYNSSGKQLWNKTWGDIESQYGYGIAVDLSDDIYITGTGGNMMFIVKYNSSGGQMWNCTWGQDYGAYGYEIVVDSFGDIYVSGITSTYNSSGIYLVKYTPEGTYLWNNTRDQDYLDHLGYGMAVDSINNLYIACNLRSTTPNVLNFDIVLIKYNLYGVYQWNSTFNGDIRDSGMDVAIDSSDNIYLLGISSDFAYMNRDTYLVKYKPTGEMEWYVKWDKGNKDDGCAIAIDYEDNIYLTGSTDGLGEPNGDVMLIKNPTPQYFEKSIPFGNMFFFITIVSFFFLLLKKLKNIKKKKKKKEF